MANILADIASSTQVLAGKGLSKANQAIVSSLPGQSSNPQDNISTVSDVGGALAAGDYGTAGRAIRGRVNRKLRNAAIKFVVANPLAALVIILIVIVLVVVIGLAADFLSYGSASSNLSANTLEVGELANCDNHDCLLERLCNEELRSAYAAELGIEEINGIPCPESTE